MDIKQPWTHSRGAQRYVGFSFLIVLSPRMPQSSLRLRKTPAMPTLSGHGDGLSRDQSQRVS